jgi:predicted DCC family thiol-disulfide oxidoreductase YuxK
MSYTVIYDGECNLCSNLVQVLEKLDQGRQFRYVPMQDQQTLEQWGISAAECELGMILISEADPQQRWRGSDAAEEIGRRLPAGDLPSPWIQIGPG